MEPLLYYLARAAVALLQRLPLTWVARLGRGGGGLVFWLDARHRRVALRNLTLCFGHEKSPAERRALAHENFRRIGENFACAVKTAAMSFEELRQRVEFVGNALITSPPAARKGQSVVAAIGHFGNFELYARFGQFAPAYKCATTYRGLRQPSLDRLLQSLRAQSGCLFFERRFEGMALKAFMNQPGVMLGLLCDQASGPVRLPFLGHDCGTTTAPAVFALRYHCALITGVCYRVGLARWRIEAGEEIPTHENGKPRSTAEIMLDVNRAFEAGVLRDPANWFWVHRRWKATNGRAGSAPAANAPVRTGAEGSKDIAPAISEPLAGNQNSTDGQ
jgi:Kdo2-lipid IVA lauroyltransferase/acyltransferase